MLIWLFYVHLRGCILEFLISFKFWCKDLLQLTNDYVTNKVLRLRVQHSNMPYQVKSWLKALSLGLLALDTLKAAIYP